MASKKKQCIIHYCRQCKADREMKKAGKGLDGKIVWLKCVECGKRTFLTFEKWESLSAKYNEPIIENEVEYDPNYSFSIGQSLYHKMWDDRGEVVKKETTTSGQNMIIVSFDRLGEKRLIENRGN